jgi:hypothetical protein
MNYVRKTKKAKFKSEKVLTHPLALIISPQLLMISCLTPDVLQRRSSDNTFKNFWVASDLSLSFSSVDLFMGGQIKSSTQDVTKKVQPSPYLRSKMGTASVVLPKLVGHHLTPGGLKIKGRCFLTCRAVAVSLTKDA